MSYSITKSLTSSFADFAKNIDTINDLMKDRYFSSDGRKYEIKFSGRVEFIKSATSYNFDSVKNFKDALTSESLHDVNFWIANIEIISSDNDPKSYSNETSVSLAVHQGAHMNGHGTKIEISKVSYSDARELIDAISKIIGAEYYVKSEDLMNQEEMDADIDEACDILDNLVPLQARISKSFENEKDFQNFLFPVLKSHFSTLQEEDYLPRVAGKASRPDFGIIDRGIAFELKYNKKMDLMKIREEVLIDSREYFGKLSPYKTMIVAIYNASGQPIPVNYIEDLEEVDVICRVIICQAVTPVDKTIDVKEVNHKKP